MKEKMKIKKLKKELENKIKEIGGLVHDSGTLPDDSGADIMFIINKKQYYIEITDAENTENIISSELIH